MTPEQTRFASEALDHVFQAFVEEIGEEPTLGELLEILGLSFQPDENLLPGAPFPLLFKAKKTGNRWYKVESSERAASLNDNTFNEAGDFLNLLVAGSGADPTHPSSVADLADHVLDVLQFGDRAFSDIAAQDLQALVAPSAKKTARVTVGDVVAIPAVPRGHHLAIVLCEDQWAQQSACWRASSLRLESVTSEVIGPAHPGLHRTQIDQEQDLADRGALS